MYIRKPKGPVSVTLPNGQQMTRADLPPADTTRWVASRKACVLRAIATGLISRDEALSRWDLSAEELDTWLAKASRYGGAALKATAVQNYPREQGTKSPAAGSAARPPSGEQRLSWPQPK